MPNYTNRHEQETTVKKVEDGVVYGADGWSFAPPPEHLQLFTPGVWYVLETQGFSLITGCRIADEWVWRRSDEWLSDDHRVMTARHALDRAERLRDHRDEWAAREAALPGWIRDRLDTFRRRGGERFELDGWGYELVVAELAAMYAANGVEDTAEIAMYAGEHGTSGNQHDCAKAIARSHLRYPAGCRGSAAGSVSALSPITGDAYYDKEGT